MSKIIQIERWGRDGIVALCDDGQLWIRPFERGWEKLQGPPVESASEAFSREEFERAFYAMPTTGFELLDHSERSVMLEVLWRKRNHLRALFMGGA